MKKLRAVNTATIAAIISIVILTILAELYEGFKNLLASIAGHHWTAKSIIALLIFLLVYAIANKKIDYDVKRLVNNTFIITIISILVIFFFYVYEFLK